MKAYDRQLTRSKFRRLLADKDNMFYNPSCTMAMLGEYLCLNRTYTSLFINDETGMDFRSFLRAVRLARSELIMYDNPTMQYTDVARLSGFPNVTAFRRAYKDKYGLAPSFVRNDAEESPNS